MIPRRVAPALVSLLLAACVTAPPPEKLAAMSTQDLCILNHNLRTAGGTGKSEVMAEIERRNVLNESEIAAAVIGGPAIGMHALVLYCTWGVPNDINRLATAGGESFQFVYEKYYGRTLGSDFRFAYVENDRITAIQD